MTLYAVKLALLALLGYAVVCGVVSWAFLRATRQQRDAWRREAEDLDRRANDLLSRWPP